MGGDGARVERRARTTAILTSRQAVLERLADSIPLIAPSMLKCDFGNLHREIELLESAQAPILHLDVMDGHFVPNLSYGPMVIERLRQLTDLPFEAHLMISDPARYADDYLKAGCNLLTFHLEAVPEPRPLIEHIHSKGGCRGPGDQSQDAGRAVRALFRLSPTCARDERGAGLRRTEVHPLGIGQTAVASFARCRRTTLLSVDGGIEHETVAETAQAGATVFVVGSAIFDESSSTARLRPGHPGIDRAGAGPIPPALIQSQRTYVRRGLNPARMHRL